MEPPETAEYLRAQVEKCRRLAQGSDERTACSLNGMADEYEGRAEDIEKRDKAAPVEPD